MDVPAHPRDVRHHRRGRRRPPSSWPSTKGSTTCSWRSSPWSGWPAVFSGATAVGAALVFAGVGSMLAAAVVLLAVVAGQGPRRRHAGNFPADRHCAPCGGAGDVASPCEAIAVRAPRVARHGGGWMRAKCGRSRPVRALRRRRRPKLFRTARAMARRRCSSFPARAVMPRRGTSLCRRMTRSGPRRTTSSRRPSSSPVRTPCNPPWRKRHRFAHTTGPTPGPTVLTGQLMCRSRIACSKTSTTWSRSSRVAAAHALVFVAHSYGGLVLDLLARTHPELVAGL